MTEERRKFDERLELMTSELSNLSAMVKEIHQRQTEVVMKDLSNIKKCLDGNGKPGLLEEHRICRSQLEQIDGLRKWVKGITISLLGVIASFIFTYGKLYASVEIIINKLGLK